ncbi:MAG: prolyl oligopeptidase family serine peptidase [Planctomycetota bacterium]|nr:prolyl oligopeptidase family serine peptidase [Planctomycetota bacterium]
MVTRNLVFTATLLMTACLDSTRSGCAEDVLERFEKSKFQDSKKTLLYRILKPRQAEATKRYPLVIFFHGAGERGQDNTAQLVHGMKDFASDANRKNYPAFVVAPQCPRGQQWVDVPWGAKSHRMPETPSESMRLAIALVDSLVQSHPIDPRKIYVTGLSMGGYGTFDAICRRPDLFAAALPICGGGDEALASRIQTIPLWAVHGDADQVVLPSRSTNMVAALQKAGGKPKLTLLKGVGHNSWTSTYSDPATFRWLFQQSKTQ